MSHIATRKAGVMTYRCDDHVHVVKAASIVVNQGVLVAEITAKQRDDGTFVDCTPYDVMLPVTSFVWYESEEAGW